MGPAAAALLPHPAVVLDQLRERLTRWAYPDLPTVESATPYMGELDLAFIPITGMAPLCSALVWRRPARDPKLRAFIGVARDVLKD